jgi:hypothetical protein
VRSTVLVSGGRSPLTFAGIDKRQRFGKFRVVSQEAQFLTDKEGQKIAAVIPIEEYDALMEDLHDLAAIAERRDEPRIKLDAVKRRLAEDGLLQR